MSETTPVQREIVQMLEESARIKREIAEKFTDKIARMAEMMISAYRKGGKVVLFGNGGSAADAQHIAGELVGKFMMERQALPAIALNTNTSILTAIGNDSGYDVTFSRQVEALVNEGDVVMALSTSGDSSNVIEAVKAAKARGAVTIGLAGGSGGRLAAAVDIIMIVPSDVTPRIQEAHITIGHIVCAIVEKELAKGSRDV